MAAKKITMELTAGDAPMMELGKMLGQTGVNLVEVKRAYDAATASQRGDIVPAVITVFEDRKFELRLKTPPTSFLIRKAIGARKTLSRGQLKDIAERKLPDLNTSNLDAAMRTVAGTARSMGVGVEPPIL
jgi:large subunit ribosomal protein L11